MRKRKPVPAPKRHLDHHEPATPEQLERERAFQLALAAFNASVRVNGTRTKQ
jgi:hypothetical protein